jgi:predicted DNA-binding protein
MSKVNLNIRVEESEMEALSAYAQQSGRTKTNVVREYLRTLKQLLDNPPKT